jgi:predicted HAD superfamily Cof-like phosphohydrolase
MSDATLMLKQFHESYEIPNNDKQKELRIDLIREEYEEVREEMDKDHSDEIDLEKAAKELADLLYVIYGSGYVLGINLDLAFERVHKSNMSKLGADGKPIRRRDGKILKGPNYFEPDMSGVVI